MENDGKGGTYSVDAKGVRVLISNTIQMGGESEPEPAAVPEPPPKASATKLAEPGDL